MAKVLVIDDDAAMQRGVRYMLAEGGHEAFQAVSGRDGVVALNHMRFDLVICDMRMPVQDGIETIQRIRELDSHIPIIAISGDETLLDDAMGMGADLSLKKPFTMAQLLTAVDGCLLDRNSRERPKNLG